MRAEQQLRELVLGLGTRELFTSVNVNLDFKSTAPKPPARSGFVSNQRLSLFRKEFLAKLRYGLQQAVETY